VRETGDVTHRFDYDSVSSSISQFLRGQAERIRRQHAASIIEIGKALLDAKQYLSHGSFIIWVETEAYIPARTAQVYMRVAQWVSDKSAAAALLSPATLHLLSAPSVPQEFIRDTLDRIDAGEHLTAAHVRKELRALRDAKQQKRCREMTTLQLRDSHQSVESSTIPVNANEIVTLAVSIMIRGLSPTDFQQVRDLLTSKEVRGDPKLARNIAAAFLRAGARAPGGI
jgi:hypothetical protein